MINISIVCVFVDSSNVAVMAKTMLTDCDYEVSGMQCKDHTHCYSVWFVNPFKRSGVKWLHFKVFRAILV